MDESTAVKPRINFSKEEAINVMQYTRTAVDAAVNRKEPHLVMTPELASAPSYGAFISLKRGSMLRACTGIWDNPDNRILSQLLRNTATSASTRDLRFPTVIPPELPFISVEISLMHDPQIIKAEGADRLRSIVIGQHGLVLKHPQGRAVFLPHVAVEGKMDARTFCTRLALKGRLKENAWADPEAELSTFKVRSLASDATRQELDVTTLSKDLLELIRRLVIILLTKSTASAQVPQALTEPNQGVTGFFIQTANNLSGMHFGNNLNLVDLVKAGVTKLQQNAVSRKQQMQGIQRINLLSQPIDLLPYDFPNRHQSLWRSAILARREQAQILLLPNLTGGPPTNPSEQIAGALKTLKASLEDWKQNKVSLTAFNVCQIPGQA